MANDILPLDIAGISVSLEMDALDASGQARLKAHYREFISTHEDENAFRISFESKEGPPFLPLDLYREWPIHTERTDGIITFESFLEQGWFHESQRLGRLTMRPHGWPENYLRVLYAWQCLNHGGLLLHAGGVIRNGKAYVFFGPSGAGKTTLTRLSQDAVVLSDDIVILGWHEGRIHAYGVPFRGEMADAPRTSTFAPVQGFYMPVKASEHRLLQVSHPRAIAAMASAVPFVMGGQAEADRVMSICEAIQAQAPVHALHFSRDPGFWPLLDDHNQNSYLSQSTMSGAI